MFSEAADDAVWKALADPSRRRILDLLRQRPRTTGELADCFEFSRYAVMKHLTVLHEAGLLVFERRGRERINRLNPAPIQRIYRRWIRPFEALPADRLLRLEEHLRAQRNREPQTPEPQTPEPQTPETDDDPKGER